MRIIFGSHHNYNYGKHFLLVYEYLEVKIYLEKAHFKCCLLNRCRDDVTNRYSSRRSSK